MALSPSPNCSSKRILSPELDSPNSKKKKADKVVEFREIPDSAQSCSSSPPPRKRNKSPGVRIVGGRIYDSENGKTCHQCRQKTMDFVVTCKSPREDKPCIMKYCHKCLLNRYGEKAESANQLDDWKCPKCRGICNCSHCMKKRGYQPIGSLLYTAKANGFRSVLEMMTASGPEMITASLKKETYIDGEYNTLPQQNLLMLPSTVKIEEFKQIKLEYNDMDDDAFEGGKDDGTQSSERTRDDNVATENEEEKTDEKYNGGEEVHNMRKKNWKRLAREKNQGIAQNRADEDGDEPDMEQGAKEDVADSEMVHEAKECSVQSEIVDAGKEDGAQLEVVEGGKEDGAQPDMIHVNKDNGAKSEMVGEGKEDGAPPEMIQGKEDDIQLEIIEGDNEDGAHTETFQVRKEDGVDKEITIRVGKEEKCPKGEMVQVGKSAQVGAHSDMVQVGKEDEGAQSEMIKKEEGGVQLETMLVGKEDGCQSEMIQGMKGDGAQSDMVPITLSLY